MPDIAAMRALGWGNPDAADFRAKHIKTLRVRGVAVPVNANPDIQWIFRTLLILLDGTGAHIAKNRDDWGYANRPIRGATAKSYHAWGLAVDVNALENVLGSKRTSFNERKVDAICRKLGLRWGFNYTARKDPMHFEFLGSPADAKRIARRLRAVAAMKAVGVAAGVPAAFLVANGLLPAPKPAPPPKPTPTVTRTVTGMPTTPPVSTGTVTAPPTDSASPAPAKGTATAATAATTAPTTVPTTSPTAVPTVTVTRTATNVVTRRITVTVTQRVAGPVRRYVIVRPGDTLTSLAAQTKTTVPALTRLNPNVVPTLLIPGSTVRYA